MARNLIVVQDKFYVHLNSFFSMFLLCNMIWIILHKKNDFVERTSTMSFSDWFVCAAPIQVFCHSYMRTWRTR